MRNTIKLRKRVGVATILLPSTGLLLEAKTIATLQPPIEPCKDVHVHPEFCQVDFWVGDCEVFRGSTKLSNVSMQRLLNDGALAESWTATHGSSDRGLSTYNCSTRKPVSLWVAANVYRSDWASELLALERISQLNCPRNTLG
jgi:hypothetical protein